MRKGKEELTMMAMSLDWTARQMAVPATGIDME